MADYTTKQTNKIRVKLISAKYSPYTNEQLTNTSLIASGSITATEIASGAVIKGLTAGTNITLSANNAENYTVNAIISSGYITANQISSGAVVKGLTAGTNINLSADNNGNYTVNSTGGNVDLTNQFRLSVTSGISVDNSVTSGASTIYLVPHIGNKVALFSGGIWGNCYSSGNVSIATSTLSSGNVHDIFCYNNNGVPALEYSSAYVGGVSSGGLTGPNVRTDSITYRNGIPVKSSDNTRRLIGTVLGFTSGQTSMTMHTKGLANYDNPVQMNLECMYGNIHTFTNTSGAITYRVVDNAPTCHVRWVSCISGTASHIDGQPSAMAKSTGAVGVYACISYAGNNITLMSGAFYGPAVQFAWLPCSTTNTNTFNDPSVAKAVGKTPIQHALGYNVSYPIEYMTASGGMNLPLILTNATVNGL